MTVTLENETLCLRLSDGSLYASGLSAQIDYTGPFTNTLHLKAVGKWVLDGNVASCENVSMEFREEKNGILVRTSFRNIEKDIPAVNIFNAVRLQMNDTPQKALITRPHRENGNQHGGMQSAVETLPLLWGSRVTSSDFAAIEYTNSKGIFGFATSNEYFSLVEVAGDGFFSAQQLLEKHSFKKGDVLVSDWVYLSPYDDIIAALPEFAKLISGLSYNSSPRHNIPVGFCSWYYYLGKLSDADILENTKWLSLHKTEYPISYIQIDAGWYEDWGDWEPNEAFHKDMKSLADSIKADGYLPGLWFCPFGATENSSVFKEHPEYFVKRSDGTLWKNGGGKYCFDFSRKDVCDHMRNVVSRFTKDWGYRYLKMDIISDVLAPGVHSDPNFNSLKNYRKCLEVVREAAGPDVFLLGCTAPMLPSVGLVDGMRISGDIFDHWECLPRIFARVLKRWWMHESLYWNDADCLIVRTASEEDDKCSRPCSRSVEEIQTFVTAMVASGGALMLSDKMSLLKKWQHRLLSYCFPVNQRPAVPLDLMESDHPSILDFGIRNGSRTVAVINWENRTHSFKVPGTKNHFIFEFWGNDFRGLLSDDLIEEVAPHCCKVFQISEASDYSVVGTDSNLILDISIKNGKYVKNKPGEKLLIVKKTGSGYVSNWE